MKTVSIAAVIALVFGFFGLLSGFIGFTFRPMPTMDQLLRQAIRTGLNVTAAAFWIVFPIVYVLSLPAEDRSPAALDWERRLRLAEEIFKREAARKRENASLSPAWWQRK